MSVAKHFAHTKWHLGRSSNSGVQATIFGAYGFIGRYVVNRLAKTGARVIIPYRGDEYDVKHLKVMGDLGQVVPFEMSIRSAGDIEKAVAGSNVVINLLGKPFETRRFTFENVNVHFPRILASLCLDLGVDRLVHFSALGAAADAESRQLKTKFIGEEAVREEFPEATILRLATVVGPEDQLFNRVAELAKLVPAMPLVHGPGSRQQPVYCLDVAAAVLEVLKREVRLLLRGPCAVRSGSWRRLCGRPRRRRWARPLPWRGPRPIPTSTCTTTSSGRSAGRTALSDFRDRCSTR